MRTCVSVNNNCYMLPNKTCAKQTPTNQIRNSQKLRTLQIRSSRSSNHSCEANPANRYKLSSASSFRAVVQMLVCMPSEAKLPARKKCPAASNASISYSYRDKKGEKDGVYFKKCSIIIKKLVDG